MTLTEQIPDNLPDWGIKAMAEERFFEVAVAKVKALEAENRELKSAGMKLKVSARRASQVLSDTELSPPGKLKKLEVAVRDFMEKYKQQRRMK
ncbi:hypothetical protein IIB79_05230 [candidate division KSB1 bacterium]|nr:hypothetical protein [candidate division KSB1 bacterium]